MKSADKRTGKRENSNTNGFTIIESVFVIAALVILSFVLAGLYLKNAKLSGPGNIESPASVSGTAPSP